MNIDSNNIKIEKHNTTTQKQHNKHIKQQNNINVDKHLDATTKTQQHKH